MSKAKAIFPIEVTDAGIVTRFNEAQRLNAPSPIVVTVPGNVTEVIPQKEKA